MERAAITWDDIRKMKEHLDAKGFNTYYTDDTLLELMAMRYELDLLVKKTSEQNACEQYERIYKEAIQQTKRNSLYILNALKQLNQS